MSVSQEADHDRFVNSEISTLAAGNGFITRPQILDVGYDDRVIAELLRSGELERIGAGGSTPNGSRIGP